VASGSQLMALRPTPYDVAFGPPAEARFQRIRRSLEASGRDPHDQDAFVLDREVVAYLRELVPEEGVGEAVGEHLALLHHAYLYWAEGGWLLRPSRGRTARLLAAGSSGAGGGSIAPRAYYVQLPERLLWAELGPGEPHQPLDGLFVRPWPDGGYFVLAVFGVHPDREGFTVVDLDGFREGELVRSDGTALFAPVLPGGEAAGLHSLVGEEELLELAARTVPLLAEARACAGNARGPHQPIDLDG
jgi:hypothetical protein